MTTFRKFTGINNVLPPERLKPTDLAMANNVDIGMDGEARRRKGHAIARAGAYTNVWDGSGFGLGVKGNDLVNVANDAVLHAGVGTARMWYSNLPDGRTAYSNGTYNGIALAATRTAWGVPIPASLGTAAGISGQLHPGDYQYSLAYVRTADGLEGGPAYAAPVTLAAGGLSLTALPVLTGYTIAVYLSTHFGEQCYRAGATAGATFSFTGQNKDLVMPCRTDFMYPAPVGIAPCLWNGRVLLAVGPVLYASQYGRVELFDLRRDFKQFSGDITSVVDVDGGIYVGTTKELAYLEGETFDKLVFNQVVDGPVVLGSGVQVDGEKIAVGEGVGSGHAMVCIANHSLVAGFSGGKVVHMTEGRYVTTATEVCATFRTINGIPQYLAAVIHTA
jgi:hypothetical protein